MHDDIRNTFKDAIMIGFTGTPIFPYMKKEEQPMPSAKELDKLQKNTSEKRFGNELHRYNLFNAVSDKNVLDFKTFYYQYYKGICDSDVPEEELCEDDKRVTVISSYILEKFDDFTFKTGMSASIAEKRKRGYNSLFTVSSIKLARKYYCELKKQIEEKQLGLKVAIVYTPSDKNAKGDDLESDSQGELDVEQLPEDDKEFLERAMKEYDPGSSLSRFKEYCKKIQQDTRSRDIDILVVVNMLLTGFDAPNLNTLWVDRNLYDYGLIQACSRTNRLSDPGKQIGVIQFFRTKKEKVDQALVTYAGGAPQFLESYTFEQNYFGFRDDKGLYHEGYLDFFSKLDKFLQKSKDREVVDVVVPKDQEKEYLNSLKDFLRKRDLLHMEDKFKGKDIVNDSTIDKLKKKFVDICELNQKPTQKRQVNALANSHLQVILRGDVTLEYIIKLIIGKGLESFGSDKAAQKTFINEKIDSSVHLRPKKELINKFLDSDLLRTQKSFNQFIKENFENMLDEVVNSENLSSKSSVREFIYNCLRSKNFLEDSLDLEEFIPLSRSNPEEYFERRKVVLAKLQKIFDIFSGFLDID